MHTKPNNLLDYWNYCN